MESQRNIIQDTDSITVQQIIESKHFEWLITVLIIANAAVMGIETYEGMRQKAGPLLQALDQIFLIIFTIELGMRLYVHRRKFFSDAWSLFDLTIVTIAWIPASGPLAVLRALRVLRILRLISVVPSLRKVVSGLIAALPGMGSIVLLLLLMFYVFSVMGTTLFSEQFPNWFGTLPRTSYTLFQIMTLESWSMGIVRPVMEVIPYAWIYFVVFIVSTSFTVLNLFIGIIVSAMSAEGEAAAVAEREKLKKDQETILEEIRSLRREIAETTVQIR